MVESTDTNVSPISTTATPREVVAAFLRLTVDTPDLKKARLHLTKRSLNAATPHAVPPGSSYTLGSEETDDLGTRIPVSVTAPAPDGSAQEMIVPVIVVQEEGQWKIDLPSTMERLMTGADTATGLAESLTQAVAQSLTTTMSGVSEGLAQAFNPRKKPAKKRAAKKAARNPAKPAKKSTKNSKPAPRKPAAKKPPQKLAKKPTRKPPKKKKR
jgi:hypothetical protein